MTTKLLGPDNRLMPISYTAVQWGPSPWENKHYEDISESHDL